MRLAALQQKNGLILHDADSLSDASASHQLSSPTHPLSTALFEADYWQSRGLASAKRLAGQQPVPASTRYDSGCCALTSAVGSSPRSASNAMSGWGAERTRAFRDSLTAAV